MDRLTIKKELIETSGLTLKEVAEQLFPGNKYPYLALRRVLSGEAMLDMAQASKLSLLTGIPIEQLYSGSGWTGPAPSDQKNVLVLENQDYRAELNTATWVTKLFHKNSLFHESVIHAGTISLEEYVQSLDQLITNYQNQNQNESKN